MTREELLQKDERILAEIVAGAVRSARPFRPLRDSWSLDGGGYGVDGVTNYTGPCCAVGMGCLFAGYADPDVDPLEYFAAAHGVSRDYAAGVSDGFEDSQGATTDRCDFSSEDYERGWAVGAAARDWTEL